MTDIKLSEADEALLPCPNCGAEAIRLTGDEAGKVSCGGHVRLCPLSELSVKPSVWQRIASRTAAPVAQEVTEDWTVTYNGESATIPASDLTKLFAMIADAKPEAGPSVDVEALLSKDWQSMYLVERGFYIAELRALARQLSAAQPQAGSSVEAPRISVVEALAELADLVDAHREGEYKIDSFTTQPARIALAAQPSAAADSVPLPQSAAQAELMEKVGYAWLKQHAPDRLVQVAEARQLAAAQAAGANCDTEASGRGADQHAAADR